MNVRSILSAMPSEAMQLFDLIQRTATEGYVPNLFSFNLDTEPDGSIYKPDSLLLEAIKPSA